MKIRVLFYVFLSLSFLSCLKKSEPIYLNSSYSDNERLEDLISRMTIEEKVGRQREDGMTEAKASRIRAHRMFGTEPTNAERRRLGEEYGNRWTIGRLWTEYKLSKPNLKGIVTDENRYKLHIKKHFSKKYHGVKFIERRKVERKIQQLERQIDEADGSGDSAKLEAELQELDEIVLCHSPRRPSPAPCGRAVYRRYTRITVKFSAACGS